MSDSCLTLHCRRWVRERLHKCFACRLRLGCGASQLLQSTPCCIWSRAMCVCIGVTWDQLYCNTIFIALIGHSGEADASCAPAGTIVFERRCQQRNHSQRHQYMRHLVYYRASNIGRHRIEDISQRATQDLKKFTSQVCICCCYSSALRA